MTNVKALEQLYVALGGDADDFAGVTTIVDALKKIYVIQGGDEADVAEVTTNSGMISALAGLEGLDDVTIAPCAQTNEYWGTLVSAMQDTDIAITDHKITGTLKHITGWTAFSGDPTEQEGNYLAVKATAAEGATITAQVIGGTHGPVTLDEDGILIARIQNVGQKLQFKATTDAGTQTITYDLSGLNLQEE